MNPTERKERMDRLVVGWMTAIYYQDDPATGRRLNGLGPADYRRVLAGYGCPQCLAVFNTYLAVCPACDFERDVIADVESPPEHWVAHLSDLASHTGGRPMSTEDFLAAVAGDPDVEQRKL